MLIFLLSLISLSLCDVPEPEADAPVQGTDFEFHAKTLYPTPEVATEPEYYGYDWCLDNYEEDVCFEYYYGYTWCLENYDEDECYNYYYGDEDWGADESYKWCLNLYDEEYCLYAYLGDEPDTWDWLSFGYQDCLKTTSADECFDLYYGYSWCLTMYDDSGCYEYYYGGEDWVWDEDSSYKWCINFYSDDECTKKYLSGELASNPSSGNTMFFVVGALIVLIAFLCVCWKKFGCSKPKKQDKCPEPTEGGEDVTFSYCMLKKQVNGQEPTKGGEDKVELL